MSQAAEGWASAVSELWSKRLARAESGAVKATLANLQLILDGADEFRGLLRMDRFCHRIVRTRAAPWASPAEDWQAVDRTLLRAWLARRGLGEYAHKDLSDACISVAEAAAFHPVQDYLSGLTWDGQPRVALWLASYLTASIGKSGALRDYVDRVGRLFLIGCVKRVMEPGCKFDNVLVLEGRGGIGKSTALNVLAGEWFADTALDIGDKDAMQALPGVWIYELGEFEGYSSVESSKAKAFFSSAVDRFRPSYGDQIQRFARQVVFVGTTNRGEYLRDLTGNRRYWPVRVTGRVDLAALREDRDQLWAEAFQMWKAGAPSWLAIDDPLWDTFESEQASRTPPDPWQEKIDQYLSGTSRIYKSEFTLADILENALLVPAGKMDQRAMSMRVSRIMADLGYEKVQARSREDRKAARYVYRLCDQPEPDAP